MSRSSRRFAGVCTAFLPAVPAVLAALAAGALACGASPEGLRDQAKAALGSGDFAGAVAACDEALAMPEAERPMRWACERIRLEAWAREGQGGDVAANLERLAEGDFAAQVNAPLYITLASYARDAGDPQGAVEILAAGDRRYPDQSEAFASAIDELKSAPQVDDATVEKLKQLGYL